MIDRGPHKGKLNCLLSSLVKIGRPTKEKGRAHMLKIDCKWLTQNTTLVG